MKQYPRFRGAMTELTISYLPNGGIDHGAIRHMVDWQVDHGIQAIFANGISSESYMMTLDEQEQLVQTMCRSAGGRIPVMCNLMIPGYRDAIDMIRRYEDAGADAICITPPYLASYSGQALREYFRRLIESTQAPVYIYNAPQTNNLLSPQLLAELANEYPHVRGYKDSTQSVVHLETAMGLIQNPEFEYIAGSDSTIFTTLALGGCGIISFISIAFPQPIIQLCDAWFAGDVDLARERQAFVMKIRDVLRKGGNSAGYKYASALAGCPIQGSRYPDSLLYLEEPVRQEIKRGLEELDLI